MGGEEKEPFECTVEQLEKFLLQNGQPLPTLEEKGTITYHHRLVQMSSAILEKQNRKNIRFEYSGLKGRLRGMKDKLFSGTKKTSEKVKLIDLSSNTSDPPQSALEDLKQTFGFKTDLPRPEVDQAGEWTDRTVMENQRGGEWLNHSFSDDEDYQVDQNEDISRGVQELSINPSRRHNSRNVTFKPELSSISPDSSAQELGRNYQPMGSTPYQPRKRARKDDEPEKDERGPFKFNPRPPDFAKNEIGQNSFVLESKFKSKFTVRFDEKKISIESYLSAVDRWRRTNQATDSQAINIALDGFVNVELSNHINQGLLSEGSVHTFEEFVKQMRLFLGKTNEEYLEEFESTKRKPTESPFVFLSRLIDLLQMGMKLEKRTKEHNEMIVRRFLQGLNPQLRAQLKARDDPVTIANCAQIAHRVETAMSLPKGASVEKLNAIDAKPENKVRFQSESNRMKCSICNGEYHSTKNCFGNPASDKFDLARFYKINSHLSQEKN